MFSALIVFIVSGALIVTMIALKAFQERSGLLLFWPRLRSRIEIRLQDKKRRTEKYLSTFGRKQVYVALHALLTELRRFVSYLQDKIDRRIHKLVDLIKGRRPTNTKGSSSSYLDDIHPYKDRQNGTK